jgi:mannosyl-3-phosphoglycerate phosphatase
MKGERPDLVVLTDVDGSLLDAVSYSFAEAREALQALEERDVPLIPVSSKTRAELEALLDSLGIIGPFVVENGGAVVIPRHWLELAIPWARSEGHHLVLELGARRPELVRALAEVARETGVKVRGFAEMTLPELEDLTGLSRPAAMRALVREYDEPFLAEGGAKATAALATAARRRGFTVTRGGRFHHITGHSDKGRAARVLLNLLAAVHGRVRSVALGDAANDAPLLAVADRPILVPRPDGSFATELVKACTSAERAPAPGPRGWNAAVLAVLAGEPLPPAERVAEAS